MKRRIFLATMLGVCFLSTSVFAMDKGHVKKKGPTAGGIIPLEKQIRGLCEIEDKGRLNNLFEGLNCKVAFERFDTQEIINFQSLVVDLLISKKIGCIPCLLQHFNCPKEHLEHTVRHSMRPIFVPMFNPRFYDEEEYRIRSRVFSLVLFWLYLNNKDALIRECFNRGVAFCVSDVLAVYVLSLLQERKGLGIEDYLLKEYLKSIGSSIEKAGDKACSEFRKNLNYYVFSLLPRKFLKYTFEKSHALKTSIEKGDTGVFQMILDSKFDFFSENGCESCLRNKERHGLPECYELCSESEKKCCFCLSYERHKNGCDPCFHMKERKDEHLANLTQLFYWLKKYYNNVPEYKKKIGKYLKLCLEFYVKGYLEQK